MKKNILSSNLTEQGEKTDLDVLPFQQSLENNSNNEILAVLELISNVLAFYKNPETQPTWMQVNQPLPDHVSLYLQKVADYVSPVNLVFGKSKPVNDERSAALFFVRKVLLIEGVDHFRALGLKAPASQNQIYNNYRNLSRLHFYQKKSEQDHAAEMRILKAYDALREAPTDKMTNMTEDPPFFEISAELELAIDVLAFYKNPETQPLWMQATQPLPAHVSLYLQYISDQITQMNLPLSNSESAKSGKKEQKGQKGQNKNFEELISAALFFVRRVLLTQGADHFRVLGLDFSASSDQVQNNYRNLRRLHWNQEKSGQDQAVVMRISEAYVVLRDPQAKRAYANEIMRRLDHFIIDDSSSAVNRGERQEDIFGKPKKPNKLTRLLVVCGVLSIVVGGWWYSMQQRVSISEEPEPLAVLPPIEESSTVEVIQDVVPPISNEPETIIDSALDSSSDDELIQRLDDFVNAPVTIPEDLAVTAPEEDLSAQIEAESTLLSAEPVIESSETLSSDRFTEQQEQATKFIDIMRLIAQAENQVARSRLTQPEGDNAYDTYLAILDKDPGNIEALQGLDNIANKYEILAKDWLKKEQYANALRMVLRGLGVAPNYEPLLALDVKIQVAMKRAEGGGNLEPDTHQISIPEPSNESENLINKEAIELTESGGDFERETDPSRVIVLSEESEVLNNTDSLATSEQEILNSTEPDVSHSGDLTTDELDHLLADFVALYGKGELELFLHLFSEDVKTKNSNSKVALKKDYQSLFESTSKRLIRLQDVRWNIESKDAMGEADFKLTIIKNGEDIPRSYEGSLTFQVFKADRVMITGLYHSQQKVE